jgi:hypothetical protein
MGASQLVMRIAKLILRTLSIQSRTLVAVVIVSVNDAHFADKKSASMILEQEKIGFGYFQVELVRKCLNISKHRSK